MAEKKISLDRREVLRKGLVAGGIAASWPVISTLNTPASASHGSSTLLRFVFVNDGTSWTQGDPSTTTLTCFPAEWAGAINGASQATVTGTQLAATITITTGSFGPDSPQISYRHSNQSGPGTGNTLCATQGGSGTTAAVAPPGGRFLRIIGFTVVLP